MVKIYTRTGDAGQTSLFTGERVPKDHLRLQVYGTLDELNAVLGLPLAAEPGAEVAHRSRRLQTLLQIDEQQDGTIGTHQHDPALQTIKHFARQVGAAPLRRPSSKRR